MAWKVDPANSEITFMVKHLRFTTVRGRFKSFEGTLNMDEQNPPASSVEGTVDVASLNTGIGLRDRDLRSRGRFNVARFPKMSFRSTSVGPFDGKQFKVYGNLTIKDITCPVIFEVVDKGELPPVKGSPASRRHAFDATIVLNRKDFGLKWNPLFEFASLLVAELIHGTLHMQFVRDAS